MTGKNEQVETYVFLSLTKFKNLEQRLQKAENVSILKADLSQPGTESSLPVPAPSPSPPPSPTPSVQSEVEMGESSEPLPPSPPPIVPENDESSPSAKRVKIGHDLAPQYRKNQIKKVLACIKNAHGGEGLTLELSNIDELINHALSQSKKSLPNMEQFYKFLYQNGLAHLIRNRHQISKLPYKAPWYHLG